MPHDGLPVRAGTGARAAAADRVAEARVSTTRAPITAIENRRARRLGSARLAGLGAVTAALIAVACGSTASSGAVAGATGTPPTVASIEASASTDAGASASSATSKGFLTFQEQNASKVFGGGVLSDLGNGSTAVTLGLVAIGYEDPLPARLVTGACTDAATAPAPSYELPSAEPSGGASAGASGAATSAAPSVEASAAASTDASAGASLEASAGTESAAPSAQTLPIELTPVSGGSSNTTIQTALADLLASPSSVLLYKSAAEPTLVACADVSATLVMSSGQPTTDSSAAPDASAGASDGASLPAESASTAP